MKRAPRPSGRGTGRGDEGAPDRVAALLAASHAVLENPAFADAARAVLTACKSILGTDGGLVAVYSPIGRRLEIVCLDPGSRLEIDAEAGMPVPLRRLAARVAKSARTQYSNRLTKTGGDDAGPKGRPRVPRNALLAPMKVGGELVGLLGLVEKAEGFATADCRFAEVFAEMTSVAMVHTRHLDTMATRRTVLESKMRDTVSRLTRVEGRFQTLLDNLPDVIARFDSELRHLDVGASLQSMTGMPLSDYLGRTNTELELPPALAEPWENALREVFATGAPRQLELTAPGTDGVRHFECRILPEKDSGGVVRSALSVARDITELRMAREVADALRDATVALTRSLDRKTVLTTLLEHLRRIIPFDRATVLLIVDATRVSIRAYFDGDKVVRLAPEERTGLDETEEHPALDSILQTGGPRLISDTREIPGWPAAMAADLCWMGVPLFARGRVAGVIALSKSEACSFQMGELQLAEAMSYQASVAIENAILFEQSQTSTGHMQMLSRRLVETQESERRRIARELHDEGGQALVSLRYGLRLLEREIAAGASVGERVAELVATTDAVMESLRRMAADLRPASLDYLGLEATLRQTLRTTGSQTGVNVRFKARGFDSGRLPPEIETALYRVVQEAMTNIARHARANRVDVLLERQDRRVLLMIEDDGVGFDPDQVPADQHFGLLGMKERAEALNGAFTVESSPGAGTTIVVEVLCPSAS